VVFADRSDAGRQLAARLTHLREQDVVVLGLPRGGVPVALEVARALNAPLDVVLVRKLGVPAQPELAMGAIGEGGVTFLNEEVLWAARVTPEELATVDRRESAELDRRARRFRGELSLVPLLGRTAVIVDDGIATGSTARAACQVARAHGAARVVLAAPIAARSTVAELRRDVDEVVCVDTPTRLSSIGQWYRDFHQVSDDEVQRALVARY
jgi:putative phosphoribosyl transferase